MRDIAFLGLLGALLIPAIVHPWIGVLVWTWISIMSPHRYTWDASQMPVAAAAAIVTLIGFVITKDQRKLPVTPVTVALGVFVLWMCVTYLFSIDPAGGWEMFKKVMKIQFMIFVALAVLHTRKHIELLVWVIVGSLAFYGVKGGVFTFVRGGEFRVLGPSGSFIEGNNELGLALIMTIPLMRYLQLSSSRRWLRWALGLGMVLLAASALGTHSRGALLAIAAMAAFFWVRSKRGIAVGIALIVLGSMLVAFMPTHWEQRMETILTYEQDRSAMGRINAWQTMWNVARDRFFGGGFDVYTPEIFAAYSPVPTPPVAAHSIYFQILGEHGFVGLALFLLVWILAWRAASWVHRNGALDPETRWTSDLAAMCQVSLVGYAVGGAFLSLAYFDLPYNILMLIVLSRVLVEKHLAGATQRATGNRIERPPGPDLGAAHP
jgi:probable O-glycosylation ligase (exosortase A-associated)